MKIYVKTTDLKLPIHLHVPNIFLFNRWTSHILLEALKEENINITEDEINHFMHEIKHSIHSLGHFNLIHVETNDGTIVDIDL